MLHYYKPYLIRILVRP